MWSGVVKVVAQVQGGGHEIGRGRGFSRPKPNIECVAVDNGGGWFKPAEVV
jgi:hypothetical protein